MQPCQLILPCPCHEGLLTCTVHAALPKVLHYGLEWDVPGTSWRFDKHWYQKFDALACPPWDLTPDKPQQGLFPHPPHPSSLTSKVHVA